MKVLAPTGNYEPDKLINVGANRWAVKLELGSIIPIKPRWLLEFELGASFFGDKAPGPFDRENGSWGSGAAAIVLAVDRHQLFRKTAVIGFKSRLP